MTDIFPRAVRSQQMALSLALSLVFAGCAPQEPRRADQGQNKPSETHDTAGRLAAEQVIVVAVDGMEPALLDRFLDQGRLPVMSQLIRDGSLSSIHCVYGSLSPVVWTTVATGQPPETHGITDFLIDGVAARSSHRKVPAFWNILHSVGIDVATVGWYVTWPAEIDGGTMISDRSWRGRSQAIHPPDTVQMEEFTLQPNPDTGFLRNFTSYPYEARYQRFPKDDTRYVNNFLLRHRLVEVFIRDRSFVDITRLLLVRDSPRVASVYLKGVDFTSHGFWKFFQPEPFRKTGWVIDQEEADLLGDIIPKYYEQVDAWVGDILQAADPGVTVILLSDHGFGPRPNLDFATTGEKFADATDLGDRRLTLGDFMSGAHLDTGVLIISGPLARRDVAQTTAITHVDILPTVLHLLGLPVPSNLPGNVLTKHIAAGLGPVKRKAPLGMTPRIDAVPESDDLDTEKRTLEELRALGYLK